MFFGFLIVNIAIFALGTSRIKILIPGSAAIGIAVLAGGQWLLENIFSRATVLPVVIELVGGIVLLGMIIKESRR